MLYMYRWSARWQQKDGCIYLFSEKQSPGKGGTVGLGELALYGCVRHKKPDHAAMPI